MNGGVFCSHKKFLFPVEKQIYFLFQFAWTIIFVEIISCLDLVIKDPFVQKLIYRRLEPGTDRKRKKNFDGNPSPQSSVDKNGN